MHSFVKGRGRRAEQGAFATRHSPFARDGHLCGSASTDDSGQSSGSTRKKRNCRNREGRRGSESHVFVLVLIQYTLLQLPSPPALLSTAACASCPVPLPPPHLVLAIPRRLCTTQRRSTDKDSYDYDAQSARAIAHLGLSSVTPPLCLVHSCR